MDNLIQARIDLIQANHRQLESDKVKYGASCGAPNWEQAHEDRGILLDILNNKFSLVDGVEGIEPRNQKLNTINHCFHRIGLTRF